MSGQHGGSRPGAGRKTSPEKMKSRPLKTLEAEWTQIQANAESAGMSVNAWLRHFGAEDNIMAIYELAVKAYDHGQINVSQGGFVGEIAKLIMDIKERNDND